MLPLIDIHVVATLPLNWLGGSTNLLRSELLEEWGTIVPIRKASRAG
jgi:hypothetical protein